VVDSRCDIYSLGITMWVMEAFYQTLNPKPLNPKP
jgi:hypothetical protein